MWFPHSKYLFISDFHFIFELWSKFIILRRDLHPVCRSADCLFFEYGVEDYE